MWLERLWRPKQKFTTHDTSSAPIRLFISYARADDEPFVERLVADLSRQGFKVWWDRQAMQSRERTFLQEVRDALETSDRVIAVIGPKAVVSRFVRYEWEYARIFAKALVPVFRLGSDDIVPPELALLHWPDFRNDRRYQKTLAELVRILREPVPPLGPCRNTPALTPHFIPRTDQLSDVVQAVTADVLRPVVVPPAQHTTVITGFAGSGKSVLAAAVARATDVRRSFCDGAVWIRMGQTPDALQKVQEVRGALGDMVQASETLEVARSRLQDVLQQKNCLLVADDVWEVEHVEPLRSALGPRCRLVVTSRDAAIATSLGAHPHPVDLLSDTEAGALLAAWTGDRFDPAVATRVAGETGNLPLAQLPQFRGVENGKSST
jgi:TIR domain/NB-ARC domain